MTIFKCMVGVGCGCVYTYALGTHLFRSPSIMVEQNHQLIEEHDLINSLHQFYSRNFLTERFYVETVLSFQRH